MWYQRVNLIWILCLYKRLLSTEHITYFDFGEKENYKNNAKCKKEKAHKAQLLNGNDVQSDSESDLKWIMVNVSHINGNKSKLNQFIRSQEVLLANSGKISQY